MMCYKAAKRRRFDKYVSREWATYLSKIVVSLSHHSQIKPLHVRSHPPPPLSCSSSDISRSSFEAGFGFCGSAGAREATAEGRAVATSVSILLFRFSSNRASSVMPVAVGSPSENVSAKSLSCDNMWPGPSWNCPLSIGVSKQASSTWRRLRATSNVQRNIANKKACAKFGHW